MNNNNQKYTFYSNCVDWDGSDVDCPGGLCDLVSDSLPITRKTFLQKIAKKELAEIEARLGYAPHHSQGLTMSADYHVEYFRSKHHNELVYGFTQSAVEYVFKRATQRLTAH